MSQKDDTLPFLGAMMGLLSAKDQDSQVRRYIARLKGHIFKPWIRGWVAGWKTLTTFTGWYDFATMSRVCFEF